MSTWSWIGIVAFGYLFCIFVYGIAMAITEKDRQRRKQLNRELNRAIREAEERDPDWAVMGGYAGLYSQEEER